MGVTGRYLGVSAHACSLTFLRIVAVISRDRRRDTVARGLVCGTDDSMEKNGGRNIMELSW
jgi:hypothetical protein